MCVSCYMSKLYILEVILKYLVVFKYFTKEKLNLGFSWWENCCIYLVCIWLNKKQLKNTLCLPQIWWDFLNNSFLYSWREEREGRGKLVRLKDQWDTGKRMDSHKAWGLSAELRLQEMAGQTSLVTL